MDVTALNATNAYAAALNRSRLALQPAEGDAPADGTAKSADFAQLVQKAAGEIGTTAKTAEQMTIAGASGKSELVNVVAAVTNAELTLETVVAVRDKVIAAYQEVMRMQI